MSLLTQDGTDFAYRGRTLRILSGAIHYFQVVPEYWSDRLLKLKACGLNTVETYIPWNVHEPEPGRFRFDGMADVAGFIRTAGELGLALQYGAAGGDCDCHQTVPAFYRGTFRTDELGDTFLDMDGWTKGIAYINGFNLGRYWNKGPQRTLYVPAPLLRRGENELVVLELHGARDASVTFTDVPHLDSIHGGIKE